MIRRLIGLAVTLAFSVLLAPLATVGQPAAKVPRVGLLMSDSRESAVAHYVIRLLPELLQRHGYVDGQTILIEWRWGEGRIARLPELADDLVRLNVDVIIAFSNGPIAAAKRATRTIPVVMVIGSVPVESGFIESLARPGGNITGTTYTPPEAAGKILQIIKEFVPTARRVTIIYDPTQPGMSLYKAQTDRAAPSLDVALHYVEIRRSEDFTFAFDRIDRGRPDALYVVPTDVVRPHLREIIRFSLNRKLPTIGTSRSAVDAGALVYYGPDLRHSWERVAYYVDRLLKGAKPADLPVEQPTKYELVINLKTAKALGLTIPQSLLVRADEVIQ